VTGQCYRSLHFQFPIGTRCEINLLAMDGERKQLVEKLVRTGHLNVPERLALGSGTINSTEVAEVVMRVLEDTGSFPENVKPWSQGDAVHEGAMLQKGSDGKIRLILQRHNPLSPMVLAEQKVTDFEAADAAVNAFIRAEWPVTIDGITIVWES
jgi:hypothetical protein